MKRITLFLSSALLATDLHAQVVRPSATSNITNSNSGGGNTVINRPQNNAESPAGQEIPVINPTSKTITVFGKTYSLEDNHLGGQFEAYLASDSFANAEAVKYRATIQQILDYLSPTKTGGPQLKPAYKLLDDASAYPGDANICAALGNSIYSALLAKQGIGNKKEYIAKLENEAKKIAYNISVKESGLRLDIATQNGKGGEKKSNTAERFDVQMMKKRLLEIEALKKKAETQGVMSLTQSKIQYQAMMAQLLMQRRYEHVIMSARFYNLIFKDGDTKMRLKKGSDTHEFFTETIGITPTVAGMDSAANEAIRKVKTFVNAYENNLRSERVHAASERLVEAFVLGEFTSAVQTLSIKGKERVLDYVQNSKDIISALSNRDLERADMLNEKLKKQALDYDPSAASSYISGLKHVSISSAQDAKLALFQMKNATTSQERYNEQQRYKNAVTEATKAWPGNPELVDLRNMLTNAITNASNANDTIENARTKFDNYLADANYRAITDKKNLFIFGSVFGTSKAPEDKERLAKFNEIVDSVRQIEEALRTAEIAEKEGSPHAAYEALYNVQERFYDDKKIANAKAQLAGKVATFCNLIESAKSKEISNPAESFTDYQAAKRIYPQSKFAKEGLKRIVDAKLAVEIK